MPLPCVPFWKKNTLFDIFSLWPKIPLCFFNSKAHVFLGKMFSVKLCLCLITALHLSTHFQAPHWEVFTIKSANKTGVLCHF